MTDQPNTARGLDLEDLEAIRARADAATPGPWGVETEDSGLMILNRGTCQPVAFIGSSGDATAETDAGFVAAAREDVPALLAEVWRLADRVHELEIEIGNAHGSEATTAAHRDQLKEQVNRLTRELEATRKAKAENDERFMTERDEARQRANELAQEAEQLRTQIRTAALPDTEEGWEGVDWRHLLLAEITGEDRDDIDPGDPNAWHRAYAIWRMQPDKTDPPTREELRKEPR